MSSSTSLDTSSVYRLTGTDLYSGLDTDEIIKALVSDTQSKIDKQQQLEQIAKWKRELLRDVISDMQEFQDTYFSYTSGTNLLSSKFFEADEIISSSNVVSATGDSKNASNIVINKISQLATKASYQCNHILSNHTITSGEIDNTNLSSRLEGDTVTFNLDGVSKTITFDFDDDSTDYSDLNNVANYLQTKLNSAFGLDKITVSTNGNTLQFTTQDSSVLTVTSSDDTLKIASDRIYVNSSYVLKDSTVTFNLDGVSKTITFHENYSSLDDIKDYLQQQLDSEFGSDKVTVSISDGALQFETTEESSDFSVVSSDNDILEIDSESDKIVVNSYVLKDRTVTFNLDGASKTITFHENYSSLDDVKNYLQEQLNSEFGSDKITVKTSGNALQFTKQNDASDLTISSSDNVLGMESSKSNRISLSTTLKDFMGDESESTTYSLTINGETLSFTGDQTLSKVISEINSNGDMGVTVTYSETTDSFYITADETGSQGKIEFEGDLATALFGNTLVDFSKSLAESSDMLGSALTANDDGTYSLSINDDKTLSFSKDQTLFGVISQINNNDDLGVTVAYSNGQFYISGDSSKVLFNYTNVDGTYTAGQDLKMNVTINGSTMDLERSSNVTTIDGVTLNITGTTDETVSFSGNDSVDELVSKIVDYVNAYNKIIDKINTLVTETRERDSDNSIAYEPLTDAQKEEMTDEEIEKWNEKAKQGLLQNDSTLNSILQDMYSAMTNEVDSVGMTLYQLGIATQPLDYTSGGQFVVDTEKLKEKLLSDPDAVVEMFTGEKGIASRVNDVLNNYVGTFGGDGILIARAGTDSDVYDDSELTLQIQQYSEIISDLKEQLETEEERYWSKFTAMEQALSILTSQSNYLMSMFSSDY
ncbi:MAG: hypothetical protein ACFWUC_01390 [Oscillospiraceae bacterium]|jgi:flagellar hook-associated protein 2